MTEVPNTLAGLTPEQRKLLALRLRMQKAKEPAPAAQRREGGVFPLSFAQQRMWLLDRLEPGATAYNLAFAWRLRGPVDALALERALGEIVRRHETLRTRIEPREGEPVQVVEPFGGWTLPVSDHPIPEIDREEEYQRLATEEMARPFDLAAGPLFRASLVRGGSDDHLFLWAVHHVASDGWSTGVFERELKALYEAFAAGRPSPLPPLPVQYGDHAVRQRQRLSGDALRRETEWWRERLAGAPALLELPTDRPRPAARSEAGETLAFELPAGVAARVDALARREGATPFMVLLAAFQAVLSRWAGQADVLVGTPIANRTSADVEGLIGYFANTLVLRGDLSGDPAFRALLARVRDTTLGAYDHQELPFEKLVEELNPERSLSHTPLFQVMFALQNLGVPGGSPDAPRLGEAVMEGVGRERTSAKFDLTFTLMQEGARLLGQVEYAADLFGAATVERFVGHYATLLDAALADSDAPVAALPLMDAEERDAVLRLAAGPAAARDGSATLHGLFEAQAARTPGAIALTFAGESLTYAGLDARANRLARLLRARGAGPETPVAVFMERSIEMVVALYGILKAGAFYVPVDPEYPAERIAWMLEDSAARIVLGQRHLIDRLSADGPASEARAVTDAQPSADTIGPRGDVAPSPPETGSPPEDVVPSAAAAPDRPSHESPAAAEGSIAADTTSPAPRAASGAAVDVIALDAPGALDGFDAAPLGIAVDPDALAYVIYTSGSTGRPKGAGNAHRGVVNRVLWMRETFALGPDDVVVQKTPYSFDVSVWEFFCPLVAGARLAVAAPGAHRDPAALSAELERAGATMVHFVPSMLQLWLDEPSAGRGSLRHVSSSGEALPADLRDRFFARLPGVELHNLYGPTEAAVEVTWHACSPGDRSPTVPIGRPVANTRIHVLDPRGEPCPLGVPGELFIAGAQVARGYWRRPALTAHHFVPDPFSALPGARMYRTGDRARWTAAGEVEYLGRLDFQVKIRGLRVEPGEVEAALAADASVREAVVAVRGEGADARLVAWLVAADGAAFSVDGLRERLGQSLPAHLVPDAFVPLDALPLTSSGKVDRRALPEPSARAGAAWVAPWSPAEIELADVWREVLGVERVGAGDDFFALGGHSLLAVKLVSRIRQRLGREIPLAELFRSRTLRALAAALEREPAEAEASPLVALHAAGSRAPIFCVHPAGGTVFRYGDLARALGPDQPFHGLQAQGVSDGAEPLATVEEMASRYLDAIRGAFPRGPYVLAGWSAGGVVAHEMARRLRAAGEAVPLVVLFDTYAPAGEWPDGEPGEVGLYLQFTHDLTGAPPELLGALGDGLAAAPPAGRPRVLAEWMADSGLDVPGATLAQIGRSVRVFGATMRAVNLHAPRPYDGDVLLLEAADATPGIPRPPGGLAPGWRPHVRGRLEVRTLPGTHRTFLGDPFVTGVAQVLSDALDSITTA